MSPSARVSHVTASGSEFTSSSSQLVLTHHESWLRVIITQSINQSTNHDFMMSSWLIMSHDSHESVVAIELWHSSLIQAMGPYSCGGAPCRMLLCLVSMLGINVCSKGTSRYAACSSLSYVYKTLDDRRLSSVMHNATPKHAQSCFTECICQEV